MRYTTEVRVCSGLSVSDLVLLASDAQDLLDEISDGLPEGHPLRNDVMTIMGMVSSLISKLDRANETYRKQIPTEVSAEVPVWADPMAWDYTTGNVGQD